MTKSTKLTMICYTTGNIAYKYDKNSNKYYLSLPLCIYPRDPSLTEEQMNTLYNIMLCKENKFKVTIERI